ncbi:MAG: M23 family metallopeptidase [Sulfurimicrobium sp.]|jgi:murein DD-endopeptidase MepM/ murein hydrolase activator NlpD|nr:M23 family metallopeptidase [Sulfurimicrobium sp.]MDP1703964.1 M23 family metallopeptidase [Sulfurimicrobium sp.]MDP1897066.1 M23 family metallopeptidase [Sulfurimicrobium sp.]MDP2197857.1 M23 family metallopeptidase [Sulfurimicrobium sp.]MDP2961912.1 M23 family metallopeptidase [Sulfurimicrobium sp.]
MPIIIAAGFYYSTLSSDTVQPKATHLQENLNAMAARLGQLQAQVLRLDAVGERLAKHFGLPEQEFDFRKQPGLGGAESHTPQYQLDAQRLEKELDKFAQQMEKRSESLSVLEAMTLREQVAKSTSPTLQPVSAGWFSSNYGWRLDPFSGKKAFHEGVDFMAETGTPIKAAAGGVVVYSDYHPQYGNMIDIDHGNGMLSRYAHASKRLVKVDDIVLQGQKIAEVGSTGRSTGPHLHFEVLKNGAPQNPARYLQTAG